jgi:hypothetical protein
MTPGRIVRRRIPPGRIAPIVKGGVIIGSTRVMEATEIDLIGGPVNVAVAGLNNHR